MKTDMLKIGIIGTGNMGGAITRGIAATGHQGEILIYDTDRNKAESLQHETKASLCESISSIVKTADIIILSVKPDIVLKILPELHEFSGIIVSVAAGISIKTIHSLTGSDKKVIRAMPNMPVNIRFGMTVLSPSETNTIDEIDQVKNIFLSVGDVLVLDEKHMNTVTAISGSGPAYIYTLIQAMSDAGVKLGITRSDASILAAQTILGSAKMFLDKKENPIILRDRVTSPGGTTIAALHVLEKAGFNGIIIDAIETAAKRAKELDKT